ncbi:hypothetical protein GEMRC1_001814 [Eukaryota sp. GEM-RC1]
MPPSNKAHLRCILSDLGRTTASSVAATALDALIFSIMHYFTGSIPPSALLGSLLGGAFQYMCCSKYVYNRFSVSRLYSVFFFFFLCWSGATIHMFLTVFLAQYIETYIAWPISRITIFLLYTFPLSRFIVFGGAAPRIEKHLINYIRRLKKLPAFPDSDYDV